MAKSNRLQEEGMLKKKLLGQYFTTSGLAALVSASTIEDSTRKIIDPMSGSGSMLAAGRARVDYLGTDADITGIEIDKIYADRSSKSSKLSKDKIICNDAFDEIASGKHYGVYDAVIGNPPYVRYQNIAHSLMSKQLTYADEIKAVSLTYSPGKVVDLSIRASLIQHLFSTKEEALSTILSNRGTYQNIDEVDALWINLVCGYSGLSDVSLPSWLMTWLLLKPGGKVGFVTTQSWKNRDYAAAQRYFMYRFMKPLHIVEQKSKWFDDAQVPTSFILLEKRAKEEMKKLDLDSLKNEDYLHTVFEEPPQLSDDAYSAEIFYSNMKRGTATEGIITEKVSVASLMNDLQDSMQKNYLKRIETSFTNLPESSVEAAAVPYELRNILNLSMFQSPEDIGLKINQGLRTGCNDFFYVSSRDTINTNNSKHSVEFGKTLENKQISVPKKYLLPVIRNQKDLKGVISTSESNNSYLINTNGYYSSSDVTRNDMSPESVKLWNEYGLELLPPELDDAVSQAASTLQKSGQKITPIPLLSAVKPNDRPNSPNPKFWHNIPLADRHYGEVIIPRVVGGDVAAYENIKSKYVIDANFNTLTVSSTSISPYAILALFNSSLMKLFIELTSSPMGGGALKVEATHLRRIPVPKFDLSEWNQLEIEGKRLDAVNDVAVIDRIVLEKVCPESMQYKEIENTVKLMLQSRKESRLNHNKVI